MSRKSKIDAAGTKLCGLVRKNKDLQMAFHENLR